MSSGVESTTIRRKNTERRTRRCRSSPIRTTTSCWTTLLLGDDDAVAQHSYSSSQFTLLHQRLRLPDIPFKNRFSISSSDDNDKKISLGWRLAVTILISDLFSLPPVVNDLTHRILFFSSTTSGATLEGSFSLSFSTIDD
jgi:hypothetical protein